ncbi:helix-turn-helix domain-containing protein [Bacillus sp. 1P06AnD]|uniref:helix-turn-helix domain-containing protein n=1 Tax=Bacillus sp. 1P06AnD TaxID=3132208 RepID=UPI0039A1E991
MQKKELSKKIASFQEYPESFETMSLSMEQRAKKINKYIVFCIFNQGTMEMGPLESEHNKRVFINQKNVVSFILWNETYKERKDMYSQLRKASRERAIRSIAGQILYYLIDVYDKKMAIVNKQASENKRIDYKRIILDIERLLKTDSFLINDSAWERFCDWFTRQLTDWTLREMEQAIGDSRMEEMDDLSLNELFYQYLSRNLVENEPFISKYTDIVNEYINDWITQIIMYIGLENPSLSKIESFLGISGQFVKKASVDNANYITSRLTVPDHLSVMSNAPYQYAREALYKKSFIRSKETPWPTVPLSKGTIEGDIQMIPYAARVVMNSFNYERAFTYARSISDLDVDLFDALCSIFLANAKQMNDLIEIKIDDLLMMRGLKAKLGGEGRRGGFEQKQRAQVLKSLSRIQGLWLNLRKMVIYEKGIPTTEPIEGRTFLFKDKQGNEYDVSKMGIQERITFSIDSVFGKFLYGSGRQVALLPLKALQYNIHQYRIEKRIARYLSWRWRTQARKGNYLQPHRISTLLDCIGEKMNERTPSRTRDRLEKALDILCQDGLIASWQYDKWNEQVASMKGWQRIWLNSTIVITPPDVILNHYSTIERKKRKYPTFSLDHDNEKTIGKRVLDTRKKQKLTLMDVGSKLNLSPSHLSNIERGLRFPSEETERKLDKWLENHT